jgi:hypothetical protein
MPSMNQLQIRRFSIPDNEHLPANLHAQAGELAALRMRSEDAGDASRDARAAVSKAKVQDANALREAARSASASPAALAKASKAQHETAALELLERAQRVEVACVEVQTRAENRWAGSMQRSAAERVGIVEGLCVESSAPVRRAAAALIAARQEYMSHVVALNAALDDDLGRNPSTNIAPSTWRPSLKSTVRYTPGGISDTLDMAKLAPALKADCCRHIAPTPTPSDTTQQAGDESAVMAGRK